VDEREVETVLALETPERSIRRELPIQFGHEQLTSYGGLVMY